MSPTKAKAAAAPKALTPIPLHGHPQKAAYTDPAQWPKWSGQDHWNDPMGMPQHTHVDLQFPVYGELGPQPYTIPFTITLFHVDGHVARVTGGNRKTDDATNWFWDDTQSSTPPSMVGDPTGIKTFSGHFDLTPKKPVHQDDPQIAHGWACGALQVLTQFANGDTITVTSNPPYFSMADPTVPISSNGPGGGDPIYLIETTAVPIARGNQDPFYGLQTAQWNGYLPLDPIAEPWPMTFDTFGYGNRSLPVGAKTQIRLDLDLHNGIPGTILYETVSAPNVEKTHVPFVIDPAQIGPGTHKLAIMRFQDNGAEENVTLFVIAVTVDPNAPPPQLVKVPNVIGMTPDAATAAITAAGLVAGAVTSVPDDAHAGTITAQSPPAGTSAPKGAVVALTLATATVPPELVRVPNVVGLALTDAMSAIEMANLAVGPVTEQVTPFGQAGVVLTQAPTATAMVPANTPIALTVSAAPPIPPTDDDGPIKGTIHLRPDGRVCVCGAPGSTVEARPDGTLCLIFPN